MAGWLAGWLAGMAGWLLAGWMAGSLVGWLAGSLVGWPASQQPCQPAGQPASQPSNGAHTLTRLLYTYPKLYVIFEAATAQAIKPPPAGTEVEAGTLGEKFEPIVAQALR